jgi:hypothetical protein
MSAIADDERQYTTELSKGQGAISETLTLLEYWEPGMSANGLADKAVERGALGRSTETRTRDLVTRVFARRYLADEGRPARVLQILRAQVPLSVLKQFMLVYTTRAARIYWPNFSTGDSRCQHQLWLPNQIEDMEQKREKRFREELLSTIADVTTNRIVDGVVRWSDVTKLRSRSQLESLRSREDAALDLKFAEELFDTIDDLETCKEALQEKLDNVRDNLDKARGQVQYWKNQYLELASGNGEEKARSPESPSPSSLSGAVETALERYGPSELEETPSSDELKSEGVTLWVPRAVQRDVEDRFEDPSSAYDALEWVATTFHHAKTGHQSCSDFDKSCRGACGFSYSAHQSETTMGQYPEDYMMEWRREKRMLRRHVGEGSDKDPRHTIRIAFFFDEEFEVVVVGYIGQHQRTPAT